MPDSHFEQFQTVCSSFRQRNGNNSETRQKTSFVVVAVVVLIISKLMQVTIV